MTPEEIFIIDSHAYLYRNYYAMPPLTSPSGEEVGALYGFTRFLLKILREKKPAFFAVCYDSPGKTFRDSLYGEYKANRKEPDSALIEQIKISRKVAAALGLRELRLDGYEADDLIAALASRASSLGWKSVIISGDKDLAQLINEKVFMWDGSSKEYFGRDWVIDKFGLPPEKIADFLSLNGDASDNVPGVKGIGPKTALKLLEKYGSVEKIIEKAEAGLDEKDLYKVKNSISDLKLSRKLVSLGNPPALSMEPADFSIGVPDPAEMKKLADRFGFREFVKMASEQGELFSSSEASVPGPEISECGLNELLAEISEYVSFEPSAKKICAGTRVASFSSLEELKGLLQSGIRKNFYKLKDFLLENSCETEINGARDLYIAYHLCHGGERKPDLAKIIGERTGFYPAPDSTAPLSFYFEEIQAWLSELLLEKGLEKLYSEVEIPLCGVLYAMEKRGMLTDGKKLRELSASFQKELDSIDAEFSKLSGCKINLNSPKQVSHFIYEKLSLPLDEKQKKMFKTRTGYTTSEEALRFLEPMSPAVSLILRHREIVKLKSSFIDVLLEKSDSYGRVRSYFDQTGTQTGRLSSSEPNLQNIPVKTPHGQLIRSCFIAPEGWTLVSADYSQIDLRVLAHLSGDENLVSAFKNGEDIHLRTACQIFGLPPSEITPEARRVAKTINFGIIYGKTPMGLSKELGISYQEAVRYINDYFKAYAGIKKWTEETLAFARREGYTVNFAGRIRKIQDINSVNRNIRQAAERTAVNMPVQSGSSDIIKKAMVEIYAKIKDREDIKMVSQVHDELLFEIEDEKVKEYYPLIREGMERSFSLSVPVIAEVKAGKNWAEMEKIS